MVCCRKIKELADYVVLCARMDSQYDAFDDLKSHIRQWIKEEAEKANEPHKCGCDKSSCKS